ncbi:MAG: hypothetical protein FJ125_02550, partial [Deltaproteobacteria bacterium]|nr:hypothetical protein [Deltaproteobacteria bacterium]
MTRIVFSRPSRAVLAAAFLFFAVISLTAPTGEAAGSRPVTELRYRQGQQTPWLIELPRTSRPGLPAREEAAALLATHRSLLRLGRPEAELRLDRVVVLSRGDRVVQGVRLQAGLPIAGRWFRLLLGEKQPAALLFGNLDPAPPLAAGPLKLADGQAAAEKVLALLGEPSLRGPVRTAGRIFAFHGSSHRAWLVLLPIQLPAGPADVRALVDAHSGAILTMVPASHSLRQGQVYETNPEVSDLILVDLPDLDEEATTLSGRWAVVHSARMSRNRLQPEQQAVSDGNGNFIFQPSRRAGSSDPFAEVQGYWHVNVAHQLFSELGLDQDVLQRMPVYVNVQGFPNAFYNSGDGSILFGDDGRDFVYDADVLYHEYTHAVVDVTAELEAGFDVLGFNHVPLALNEGFADSFSTVLSGDPVLGEYVGWDNGAIRRMEGDATCPGDFVGESHEDGLLWAQTSWELRGIVGEQEHPAYLWGVLNLLGPTSDFISLAEAAVRYARRHY